MEKKQAERAIKQMLMSGYGHYSRMEEHKLITAFLKGDVTGFTDPHIAEFPLASQPLRSIKNNLICAVAVMCRYAADLGADDERCYALSDYYINEIEDHVDIHNWYATILEIARHYTELVRQGREEQYTLPVRKAIRYIHQHLYEPCSLNQVAKAVQLHPSYLSALFKSETGVLITQYIRALKISEAKNLLKDQSRSVSEIAELLGYRSLSYFSKVFHRVCGCGPREFLTKKD
ncbi:MAG: hypothetical protein K0R46_1614 [Herbinix sp.]|nr:hypothetical protein [Herbinix sp.]